jgi:predicted nuclease of predicted toxin-antitoxin system
MRLYLDEDLSPRIAVALRRRGIDAVSAHEVGNTQRSDAEQLAYATRSRRALVTRNARHFLTLAHAAVERQTPHAGIVLCPPSLCGVELRVLVRRLAAVVAHHAAGLDAYDVIWL